jgi:SAM-dependent methyltransferase
MSTGDPTIDYYNQHGAQFAARTMSRTLDQIYPRFYSLLKPGAHILEAGCGPGRDAKAFLDRGYKVTAFDASQTLAQMAEQLIGQPVRVMRFEELEDREEYDGVWASASLLHVPSSKIDDALMRLARALKPGGVLYMTVKTGEGEKTDSNDRLFNHYTPQRLRETLARQTMLEAIDTFQTGDTRPDFEDQQWTHGIARRCGHARTT